MVPPQTGSGRDQPDAINYSLLPGERTLINKVWSVSSVKLLEENI